MGLGENGNADKGIALPYGEHASFIDIRGKNPWEDALYVVIATVHFMFQILSTELNRKEIVKDTHRSDLELY